MATETFTPPGDVGADFLISPPPRFADRIAEGCYFAPLKGTCLEPEIFDGDMVLADPNRTPEIGEFAIFWPSNGRNPSIKRLVTAIPPTFAPGSEVSGVLIVEQLNPPKQYLSPADRFKAIHAVIGWMKPEEYEPLRRPVDDDSRLPRGHCFGSNDQ